MKPRHAAALALVVGWLLMEPPYRTLPAWPGAPPGTNIVKPDMTAPFSQWTVIKTFPTEKVCHEQAPAIVDDLVAGRPRPPWTRSKEPFFEINRAIGNLEEVSRCVAVDDFRLKAK
jgi:hypothetical protein